METVSFGDLPLLTLPGLVMTPRAATERLVDAALSLLGEGPARVADVGTGSGAIALAIAARAPRVEVIATDTSKAAVGLARANAARLGLGARVSILAGDLLAPAFGTFDLILANLPYLAPEEARADEGLRDEPEHAVAAPGDGLDPYRRLVATSRCRLRPSGALVIQLRRRVVTAQRRELDRLAAGLELQARPRAA